MRTTAFCFFAISKASNRLRHLIYKSFSFYSKILCWFLKLQKSIERGFFSFYKMSLITRHSQSGRRCHGSGPVGCATSVHPMINDAHFRNVQIPGWQDFIMMNKGQRCSFLSPFDNRLRVTAGAASESHWVAFNRFYLGMRVLDEERRS